MKVYQYSGLIDVYPIYFSEDQWAEYFLSDITPEGEKTIDHINYYLAKYYKSSPSYVSSDEYQEWLPDYVAMPADSGITEKMEELGHTYIEQVGDYNIYRMDFPWLK